MFFNTLLASTKWYPTLFDSPLNATRAVAFWLTIALVLAYVVCALVLKGESKTKFFKIGTLVAIVYAVVVGITLLSLTFVEDGIVTLLFVPLLVLIVAVAASAVLLIVKRNKVTSIVSACITGCALVATLVCVGIHFGTGASADLNEMSKDDINQIGLYVGAVLLVVAVVAVAFIVDRRKFVFDTKSIAYAAVCIAMSFALSYLRLVKMPQGGSITIASLLPIMLFSYMFGARKGIFAGMIYGLLQAIQDPYIVHPAQFVLDYPAAFACIGLTGLFADFKPLEKLPQVQFLIGGIIAGVARLLMHFISGVFAFGSFAPWYGYDNPWVYSICYNAAYVLPDIAVAIVVGVIVLCAPSMAKQVKKFAPKEKATETPSAEQK
jgi:thiamine transporter